MLAPFLGQSPDLVAAAMSRLVAGHHVSGLYVATATWTIPRTDEGMDPHRARGCIRRILGRPSQRTENRQHTINGDHDWY